jgi:hypothetical protein
VTSVLPKVGGERLAENPSSRGRSSIPPTHPVALSKGRCRAHRRDVPPCRGPPSPRGHVKGTKTHTQRKKLALLPPLLDFPAHFTSFSSVWYPGTCLVVRLAPVPSPLRSRVHRAASFERGPSRSRGPTLFVYRFVRVVGVERGGGGRRSRILRAAGARKLVKTLLAGFSGGADPEGRHRHIVSLPPLRPTSLSPKRTPPPGRCSMSTWQSANERSALVLLPNWFDAWYGHCISFQKSPPYMAFRRRLILRIAAASPSRSSACDRPPACVMSCLSPREGSTGTWLVESERAPFHGAPSRLSIASSNARVPPLIRLCPPRHHTLMRYMPHWPTPPK